MRNYMLPPYKTDYLFQKCQSKEKEKLMRSDLFFPFSDNRKFKRGKKWIIELM